MSVETVEEISRHHSPYGHDLSDSCQQTSTTCSRITVTYSGELILVHIVPIRTRTSGHVGVIYEEVHNGGLAIVVSTLWRNHNESIAYLHDCVKHVDQEQLGAKVLVILAMTVQLRHRHEDMVI